MVWLIHIAVKITPMYLEGVLTTKNALRFNLGFLKCSVGMHAPMIIPA